MKYSSLLLFLSWAYAASPEINLNDTTQQISSLSQGIEALQHNLQAAKDHVSNYKLQIEDLRHKEQQCGQKYTDLEQQMTQRIEEEKTQAFKHWETQCQVQLQEQLQKEMEELKDKFDQAVKEQVDVAVQEANQEREKLERMLKEKQEYIDHLDREMLSQKDLEQERLALKNRADELHDRELNLEIREQSFDEKIHCKDSINALTQLKGEIDEKERAFTELEHKLISSQSQLEDTKLQLDHQQEAYENQTKELQEIKDLLTQSPSQTDEVRNSLAQAIVEVFGQEFGEGFTIEGVNDALRDPEGFLKTLKDALVSLYEQKIQTLEKEKGELDTQIFELESIRDEWLAAKNQGTLSKSECDQEKQNIINNIYAAKNQIKEKVWAYLVNLDHTFKDGGMPELELSPEVIQQEVYHAIDSIFDS